MGGHVGGSRGGSRGGSAGGAIWVRGGVGGLCYARSNIKKTEFYVILRGVLWGSVGGGMRARRAWGVCVT